MHKDFEVIPEAIDFEPGMIYTDQVINKKVSLTLYDAV